VEPGGAMWELGRGEASVPVLPDVSDVPGPCFLGRFAHTLDDKRRVSLPKAFREELDEGRDGASYFLIPAFDPCLWLFTEARFTEFKSRIAKMAESGYGVGDSKVRAFRREIFSRCAKLAPDKQGRIALPPELCRTVGIDKEVVFLGVDERVELWSPRAEQVKDDPDRLWRLSRELIG
jgi:MraZ protein